MAPVIMPPGADSGDEPPVDDPDATVGEAPPRTGRLAIIALVTGLLGIVPLALAFGIAALVRVRHGSSRGKGLAVGGLGAALAWVVAWTAAIVVIVPASGTEPASGEVAADGKVRFSTLREGDCYAGVRPDAVEITLVEAVPCDEPHQGEVIALAPFDAVTAKAGTTPVEQATPLCDQKAAYLEKSRLLEHLKPYVSVAKDAGEEPVITCAVHYVGPETLDTRLGETLDQDNTTYSRLPIGECIEHLDDLDQQNWADQIARPVPCTEPHRYQVYADFDLVAFEGATWDPVSEKSIEEKAERKCVAEAGKMLPAAPTAELELTWLIGANRDGVRKRPVICFVGLLDRTELEKSIVSK